jgi:uncharacterized protein
VQWGVMGEWRRSKAALRAALQDAVAWMRGPSRLRRHPCVAQSTAFSRPTRLHRYRPPGPARGGFFRIAAPAGARIVTPTMATPTCRLNLKITPGAPRDEVLGELGDAIRVKLRAPPVDGKANDALIRLLADTLDLHASAFRLVVGATARRKVVEITGLAVADARRRLLLSKS